MTARIKNAKNATITMTDLDGNQLYTNSFRTVGQYIDKFAFYVPDVQVDIGYMSLSTTTLFRLNRHNNRTY